MTDSLEPNDLSHLSDEEFHALCPIGEHAPGPEPLSPAAQAVLDVMSRSYDHEPTRRLIAAGILRALADHQPAPITLGQPIDHWRPDERTRQELRNIAAELEGGTSTSSTH